MKNFKNTNKTRIPAGITVKRLVMISLYAAIGAVCLVNISNFIATNSDCKAADAVYYANSANDRRNTGHSDLSVPPAVAGEDNDAEENHLHDYSGKENLPPDQSFAVNTQISGQALDENSGFSDDDTENIVNSADFKEQLINKRFGVISRNGKWIPTTGGGTSLVYITTGSLPAGQVGETYDVQFEAVSGCPPYYWTIIDGQLPESFVFDPRFGRLSGIASEPGTTSLLLEVVDSAGAKDMAEYVLVFQPEQALEIVSDVLPSAVPGTEYFCQLEATGGVPPYTWNATGDIGDIGTLFLDPATGIISGQIADFPSRMDVPLEFWVTDSLLCVSKALVLHIRTQLSIVSVPRMSVKESDVFELAFQAVGGAEPYVWSADGELPPGLDFSKSGVLSGKPGESGFYEMDIHVYDADGLADNTRFELEILPSPADVSDFQALLSRTRVALSWKLPASGEVGVRIVRSVEKEPLAPEEGTTVYQGNGTEFLDENVVDGVYYYAAFLEENGAATTSPPPAICVTMPPDVDPFADKVVDTRLLHPNAFRSGELPGIVLGPPNGTGVEWGSMKVVSLGAATNDDDGNSAPYGGSIVLEFTDNAVLNGPGADFTVFENVFYICDKNGTPDPETRFMEPAVISVSQDGVNWRQFKFDFSPRYHPETGEINLRHPYTYNSGFAGINPVMSNGYDPDPTDPAVSGGDSFDIADVGLDWIRYVRIQSTGNRWLVDESGGLVYHTEESNSARRDNNKAGFDLDAATAIWVEKVDSSDNAGKGY